MGQRPSPESGKEGLLFTPVGASTAVGSWDPLLPRMGGELSGPHNCQGFPLEIWGSSGGALQLVSRWWYWAYVSGPSRLVNNLRATPQDFGLTLEGKRAFCFLLFSSASTFNGTRPPYLEQESPPRPSLFPILVMPLMCIFLPICWFFQPLEVGGTWH